jgi:hypothetical protein
MPAPRILPAATATEATPAGPAGRLPGDPPVGANAAGIARVNAGFAAAGYDGWGIPLADTPPCCHIDHQSGDPCGARATWEIRFGPGPDDYSLSCDDHQALFLGEDACAFPFVG